jgi:N-acetylglutamate synthase-like GNAT family acetyltransferase
MQLIRLAKPEEIIEIINLIRRSFAASILIYNESPPDYDSWQKIREHIDNQHCYIYYEDNHILGGAIIYKKEFNTMYLSRIFVDPECNNRGIGSNLMNFLLSKYSSSNWLLHCIKDDKRLEKFYCKLGFKKIGEETPQKVTLSIYRKELE